MDVIIKAACCMLHVANSVCVMTTHTLIDLASTEREIRKEAIKERESACMCV